MHTEKPRFPHWSLSILTAAIVVFSWPWVTSNTFPFGDDNSSHFAAAMHMAAAYESGESNLWWHQSNLGVPLFAAYQPLPTMLTGLLIAWLGAVIQPIVLFKGTIIAAWAAMPWAWYRGSRAYGLPTLFCIVLGLLTICVHDPFSIGFGSRSATVRGLYTQHFGLLFLPLFVGSFQTLLKGSNKPVLPTAALYSITAMSHLWVGLYAAIIGFALILSQPKNVRHTWRKLLQFGGLGLAMLGWWLVPLLQTNAYAGGLPWLYETHNGWPIEKMVRMLATGAVFDHERIVWLTPLVLLGGVGMLLHSKKDHIRPWLITCALTLVLFLGRTNLGEWYNLIPLHSQINVMRYLTGIHICGLVAATGALFVFLQWVRAQKHRLGDAVTGIVCLGIATFGAYDLTRTLRTFDASETEFAELVDYVASLPDHRIAVHKQLGTGNHFHRDLLPLLTQRGQLQSYAHGFHTTLSTYYAEYFDFSPAACRLFDIGSIVAKRPAPSSFPASAYIQRWENDRYIVYEHKHDAGAGPFSFIDVRGSVEARDFRSLRPAIRILSTPAFATGVLPKLSIDTGIDALRVRNNDDDIMEWKPENADRILEAITEDATPPNYASTLRDHQRDLAGYSVTAEVADNESPWLLLKVNMFPWWTAQIDDRAVPIEHVAPNFMAIKLPPGTHRVQFRFNNPWHQKAAALLSLMLIFTAFIGSVYRFSKRVSGTDSTVRA